MENVDCWLEHVNEYDGVKKEEVINLFNMYSSIKHFFNLLVEFVNDKPELIDPKTRVLEGMVREYKTDLEKNLGIKRYRNLVNNDLPYVKLDLIRFIDKLNDSTSYIERVYYNNVLGVKPYLGVSPYYHSHLIPGITGVDRYNRLLPRMFGGDLNNCNNFGDNINVIRNNCPELDSATSVLKKYIDDLVAYLKSKGKFVKTQDIQSLHQLIDDSERLLKQISCSIHKLSAYEQIVELYKDYKAEVIDYDKISKVVNKVNTYFQSLIDSRKTLVGRLGGINDIYLNEVELSRRKIR